MKRIFTSALVLYSSFLSLKVNSQSELWGVTTAGGDGYGTLFSLPTGSNSPSLQFNFSGSPGASPQHTKLLELGGKLYGMTMSGGTNNSGVLFEYNLTSGAYISKHDFIAATGSNPRGPLVVASGKLYGMTSAGGANGAGVIFEYDVVNNIYTKKIDLVTANGSVPYGGMVLAADNKLYGLTRLGGANNFGTIFQYDPSNNSYTKRVDFTGNAGLFQGSQPFGTMVEASGKLYGLASSGGTSNTGVLFEYDYVNNIYTKKVDLINANGSNTQGSLVLGSNGKLYGMTLIGGANNAGVIFEYNIGLGVYTKLYDLLAATGSLPSGSLIEATNGKLYGMTRVGGASNGGAIFEFNLTGNVYTKLVDLVNSTSVGGAPFGTLFQASDQKIYGMTSNGGFGASGVLFQYDISNTTYTKKVDFNASNGGQPNGELIHFGNNKLYGMALSGGLNNVGIIYEYDKNFSQFTKKIDLSSANGSSPYGGLCKATNNKLYGLTNTGGTNNMGVLFEYDPSNNSYVKKVDLALALGTLPFGSLVQSTVNNKLYGLTRQGGASNLGVIFEYDITGNTYLVKYSFASNGTNPSGSLTQVNGKLYGLTQTGGVNGQGVLFEYDPSNNTYTKKVDLSTATGGQPNGSLELAQNGKLYGMTRLGGVNGQGVIFEYDITNNTYTKKIDFNATSGTQPLGSLVKTGSGKLYGMTQLGGTSGFGTLFEYDPSNNSFTKLIDWSGTNGSTPGYTRLLEICYLPAAAGAISTSSNAICQNNATLHNYSISAVSGATSYTWNLPAGAVISGTNNSNMVSVNLSAVASGNYSFGVNPVNVCGNGSISVSSVTVHPLPSISVNSGSICLGNSFTIVPSGAATYTFSGGSNIVSPAVNTNYMVSGTSALGCPSSNTAVSTVSVVSLPVVTANVSSSVICFGNTTTLFGSGASTYTWTGGVTNNVPFSPATTAAYSLTGTSAAGCTSTNNASQTVTVNPLPVITANVSNSVICFGNNTTLFGTGASTYTWTGGVSNNVPFAPSVTSSYSVTGTSTAGCTSTNVASRTITVNPLPVVNANATSSAVCFGNSTTLFGSGASTYTWTGGVSNGVSFNPSATANYTVTGTSAAGCTSTNSAVQTVVVNPLPVVTANVTNSVICQGSTTSLFGSGATTYTWTGGVTNNVPFSPSVTASYSVTGTNSSGCTSTNTAFRTITVNPRPVITASGGTVCAGSPFTFVPSGSVSYTYSSGSATVTPSVTTSYSISGTNSLGCVSASPAVVTVTAHALPFITVNSGSICAGNSFTLIPSGAATYTFFGGSAVVTPSATTFYTVSGTSSLGCVSPTSAISIVTVAPLPTITVNSGSICEGSSFTIVPSGAVNYTISGGSAVVSPVSSSSYVVTGANAAGCVSQSGAVSTVIVHPRPVISAASGSICLGDVFTHTVSGAASYNYSSGSATVSPNVNTTYSVTGTSTAGCISASPAIVNVTVHPLPILAISGNTVLCAGDSTTLSASGATSYTWSVGSGAVQILKPATSTAYSVQGTNSLGCVSAVSNLTVVVNPLPTITVNNGAVCPGNSFTITPSGAATYTITGGSNIVTPVVTSNYQVSGTSSDGCVSAIPAVATVSVVNILTVTISGPNAICLGGTVNLTANGASTYSWNTGAGTNTLSVVPSSNVTYTVIGSSGSCSDTTDIMITVHPLPQISVAATSSLICLGQSAMLTVSGAANYSWSGGFGSGSSINVSPSVTTTYEVVGIDVNGCSDSTSYLLEVNPCEGIFENQTGLINARVYPNPNQGRFTVYNDGHVKIEVLNTLGQSIFTTEFETGYHTVDLSEEAKGLYFIRLSRGGSATTLRMVKQ